MQRELVTPKEIERLKAFKGNRPFLPVTWALQEIEAALERTHGKGSLRDHESVDVSERYRVADVLTIFREKAFKVHAPPSEPWAVASRSPRVSHRVLAALVPRPHLSTDP